MLLLLRTELAQTQTQIQHSTKFPPPPAVLLNAAHSLALQCARLRIDPVAANLKRIDSKITELRQYKYLAVTTIFFTRQAIFIGLQVSRAVIVGAIITTVIRVRVQPSMTMKMEIIVG
ncbi:hypothetical protein TWF694_011290 [Orbilia ellipsospora]|uniref:Uncharacterized protein n=1 Tax=Orbilia ellipsospora TaxID=2528407 RepID=A0AAV9X9L1_9PEZI